ncbi:MAG: clostripain-related cysteine peptidase [Candidatus Eremiobacteraeota bacterium]|nr:clostripain-related cysteine peptidase [Candidatus Eremiobacteraeota bacterium]
MDNITPRISGNIPSPLGGAGTPQPPAELRQESPGIPTEDTFERKGTSSEKPEKKVKKEDLPAGKTTAKEGDKLKEYTILAYMDGSNNLEEAILDDVKEMESVAPENMNVVVQFSRYQNKPMTVMFLSESLSKAFQSREFKGVLKELIGDKDIVERYGELLKDPYTCNSISSVLLRRNPDLSDKLDRLVDQTLKDTSNSSRTLKEVINETAGQILGQIIVQEQVRAEVMAQMAEEEGEIVFEPQKPAAGPASSLSSAPSLIDIMGDSLQARDEPLINQIARAAGSFIKSSQDTSSEGAKVLSASGTPVAEALDAGRNSIIFVESMPGSGKFDQGDYSPILSQVDDVEVNKEPQWRGVRRFEISKDDDQKRINSKQLKDMGMRDMSKVKTLSDFIAWGMKNYPAKHYIVLMSDHGAGFLGAEEDRGNMLSLPNIREAFEKAHEKTGIKPDIIAFDACLMAQAEVAYELKDQAKYLIASEEIVGGDGYPYRTIFPAVDKALSEGKTDPRDVASIFIEESEKANKKSTFTLSAIDLEAAKKVVSAANDLAKDILEGKADLDAVRESFKEVQHYNVNRDKMRPYSDFRDLGDLVDKLSKNPAIKNRDIKRDLKELKAAVEQAVVKEEHMQDEDYEGSHGISIFAPRRQSGVSVPLMEEYDKILMSKRTKWNELVKVLTDFEGLKKLEEEEGGKGRITFIPLPQRRP